MGAHSGVIVILYTRFILFRQCLGIPWITNVGVYAKKELLIKGAYVEMAVYCTHQIQRLARESGATEAGSSPVPVPHGADLSENGNSAGVGIRTGVRNRRGSDSSGAGLRRRELELKHGP